MKTNIIQTLISMFEPHAQQTGDGIKFWLYEIGQFLNVIFKAKMGEVSGHPILDHLQKRNR